MLRMTNSLVVLKQGADQMGLGGFSPGTLQAMKEEFSSRGVAHWGCALLLIFTIILTIPVSPRCIA